MGIDYFVWTNVWLSIDIKYFRIMIKNPFLFNKNHKVVRPRSTRVKITKLDYKQAFIEDCERISGLSIKKITLELLNCKDIAELEIAKNKYRALIGEMLDRLAPITEQIEEDYYKFLNDTLKIISSVTIQTYDNIPIFEITIGDKVLMFNYDKFDDF